MAKPRGPVIPAKRVANPEMFKLSKVRTALGKQDTTNVPDPKGFVDRMVKTMADAKLYGYVKACLGDGEPTLTRWCEAAKELVTMELRKMERDGLNSPKEMKAHANLVQLKTLPAQAFFRAINNVLSNKGIKETYGL